ncbi:protein SHOOT GRAVITROPISM 5-like [Ananas comosus]|uniref:Protein SHOOT GRAVITROPISM 5-like n=1 Tax=Ananas comosus TaxID=4615 RepID=A0A6P5GIH9_ANACO|nr:protein SHOOT GRAVITROPISM 5-like [Ananas comosus]
MHQHHQMLASSFSSPSTAAPPIDPPSTLQHDSNAVAAAATIAAASTATKRKRRPAGTPDPDAEVVSLSPRTLLESDRYVCEICKKGFQRDQNLQMHRRRHKVPWKLAKRTSPEAGGGGGGRRRQRVYVCPEPNCLHHEAGHALGDLVGIKKHFRRKHGGRRQWGCGRCGRAYAVQSDYKAHLKTCGTRGHSCDCGRVFSRVESFIEHQDECTAGAGTGAPRNELRTPRSAAAASTPTPLPVDVDANSCTAAAVAAAVAVAPGPTVELQLLPAAATIPASPSSEHSGDAELLRLSIGPVLDVGKELARLAVADKAAADEERELAAEQAAAAEREYSEAVAVRQRARAELEKAIAVRDCAARRVAAVLGQLTCHTCRASHVRAGESSVDVP